MFNEKINRQFLEIKIHKRLSYLHKPDIMNLKAIKLVATDIDGVWTDGSMYYTEKGDEFKRFHTYDGASLLFLKKAGIHYAILTGEDTNMVANRAKKLGIERVYQGVKDKVAVMQELCNELGIGLEEVAYIGDDLNDRKLLPIVGFSACPQNAPSYIQKLVHKVLTKKGGEGVFREFVEYLLSERGELEEIIDQI